MAPEGVRVIPGALVVRLVLVHEWKVAGQTLHSPENTKLQVRDEVRRLNLIRSVHGSHPYAIKTQRKAINDASRGL